MNEVPAADKRPSRGRAGGTQGERRDDRKRELKASVNSAVRLFGSMGSNWSWRVAGHFLGYFFRKAVLRTPVPFYLSLAVTNRCQGRCVHCYSFLQRKEERPELTTAELKSVIDQAARLGIFQIIFTGGEPLLRKDIQELVRHARRRGLLTRLNTNSLLLDKETAAALKKAGLNQCALSLDDADPETHDRMRGLPGHHARTLENLSMLRDLGIYALANVYISARHLASGPEKTIALAREAGARGIVILPAVASGRWEEEFDQVPDAEGRARIRDLLNLTTVQTELPSPRSVCDTLKRFVLYMTAQGDLTPCPFVPYAIGNLKEHALDDMWRSYCEAVPFTSRGECPMNDLAGRALLQAVVASAAEGLRERSAR
jgi:MoaA/NifB/PqqE/SkfB family radical SAM enzyme